MSLPEGEKIKVRYIMFKGHALGSWLVRRKMENIKYEITCISVRQIPPLCRSKTKLFI